MILPNGYELQTTFVDDFRIARAFGTSGIKDTYNRALKEWKSNYKYLTELEVALNIHCWDCYEKGLNEMSELFSDLYYECRDTFYDIYGKDKSAIEFHFNVTD